MANGTPPQGSQFDLARKRAQQGAQRDTQSGVEASKRRFARIGALNTGAAIKSQERAGTEANERRDVKLENIGSQEAAQAERKADIVAGRNFQSGEAQKGRDFQSGQSDIDRKFRSETFEFDKSSKLAQMDLMTQQFDFDKKISLANLKLAKKQFQMQEENTGGLFGSGGFLGTGI